MDPFVSGFVRSLDLFQIRARFTNVKEKSIRTCSRAQEPAL